MEWQKEFSQLGYYSVDAMVHLPKHEGVDVLQYCYEDLKQLTSDLSFFPPLLISHGQTAWRIAQKYVSNKPVSGLVLVDQQHKGESLNLPSNEFEPRFPILHVNSHQDSKTPDFLEGWIDVIKTKQDQEFKELKNWMDQMGM
ncbi:hypothetical protein G6F56_011091 [Rhizopus delemar]|nr:hypothetical protein G6F56_011091 [Rhizopus delemar]